MTTQAPTPYAIARQLAPDIAIEINIERDDFYQWDGDGPDPAEDGMSAHDVDIAVRCIFMGELIDGMASLGGVYLDNGEIINEHHDIHGYRNQMIREAAQELIDHINSKEWRDGHVQATRLISQLEKIVTTI